MIENILRSKPILLRDYPFLLMTKKDSNLNNKNNIKNIININNNHLVYIDVEIRVFV